MDEPVRERAVAVSRQELADSVSVLEKEVGQLEDSMGDILRSKPPASQPPEGADVEHPACELARTINAETQRIKAVSERLKSIELRLEA